MGIHIELTDKLFEVLLLGLDLLDGHLLLVFDLIAGTRHLGKRIPMAEYVLDARDEILAHLLVVFVILGRNRNLRIVLNRLLLLLFLRLMLRLRLLLLLQYFMWLLLMLLRLLHVLLWLL